MKTKISIFLFTAVIFFCCKTSSKVPTVSLTPDAQDEAVAKTKWPDADLAQLNSGHTLYTANCQRCHELHSPSEFNETDWTKLVASMGRKAKLEQADQQLILHYLLAKREVMLSQKPK